MRRHSATGADMATRLPLMVVTVWMMFATPGAALLCFHCNSAGRPGCADPFDADALEPLACDPPPAPVPGASNGRGGGGVPPTPHPDAETLDASLEEGDANATNAAPSPPTHAPPLADAHYFDLDAPPVVRCLKEERAVSETASVVVRTCVLVAEDTPEFGCSPHPAALHCSLCAEDECNAAAVTRRPAPLPLLLPLAMAVMAVVVEGVAPRC